MKHCVLSVGWVRKRVAFQDIFRNHARLIHLYYNFGWFRLPFLAGPLGLPPTPTRFAFLLNICFTKKLAKSTFKKYFFVSKKVTCPYRDSLKDFLKEMDAGAQKWSQKWTLKWTQNRIPFGEPGCSKKQ